MNRKNNSLAIPTCGWTCMLLAMLPLTMAADCHGNGRGDTIPCFNMQSRPALLAHVVERLGASPSHYDHSAPILSGAQGASYEMYSCAGLDDFAAGVSLEFTGIEVGPSEPTFGSVCSPIRANLMINGLAVTGDFFNVLQYYEGPGTQPGLVTAAWPNAVIGACTGTWVVSVNAVGLFETPAPIRSPADGPAWDDARVYDPGRAGGTPPVVIHRVFSSDDPDCLALVPALATHGECFDTMVGYLSEP